MNSLSEFLSSLQFDFIPSNLPSNNTEWPNELDILLETLSKSDIQLLDRRVTNDLVRMTNANKARELLLPMLPISHAILRALEIPLTIPLR